MVLLLLFVGCSGTPIVVESAGPTESIPAVTRSLIEADPKFQTVVTVAATEGKVVNWSKASQTTDANGQKVVQLPLWWDDHNMELLIIAIEQDRVSNVLLSRITLQKEKETAQIALADLSTGLAMTGRVISAQGKPVLDQVVWGAGEGVSTLDQLLRPVPEATEVTKLCNWSHPDVVLATAALTLATQAMYAACWWAWWTPACWLAVVAYGVTLLSYNNVLRQHGCL
jgi:hypothetical protein